jgi:hypothetical protein
MSDAVFEQPIDPTAQPAVEASSAPVPTNWIEIFFGILVEPIKTMRFLADANGKEFSGFGGAVLAVILPCALDGLRMTSPSQLVMAWVNVPVSIILGLLMWTTLAGLFSLTGWIFGAPTDRARRAFVLTGWAFTPWTFMAPLYCFRDMLGFWFALLAVIPFAWMFVLQMLAVREAFQLKSVQMLLLFFAVPALYVLLQSLQLIQGVYVSLTSIVP